MARGLKPPYDLFKLAIAEAEETHPGADKYVINWHSEEIYIEVWREGHAKVTGPWEVG